MTYFQGFSEMNRHKGGKNAQMKNSLVCTFLNYCDFYRPKIFILENVGVFATDKCTITDKFADADKSTDAVSLGVLNYCIKRLLNMGYQCTYDILQVILKVHSTYKSILSL